MSKGNWFEGRRGAFGLRTKAVTTTYTTRAGGSGDNFIEDRVITVSDPADNFTITISDGTYEGQRLLIAFLADTNNKTVTLTPDNGSATNLTAAGGYSSLEWMNATTTGWVEIAGSAT